MIGAAIVNRFNAHAIACFDQRRSTLVKVSSCTVSTLIAKAIGMNPASTTATAAAAAGRRSWSEASSRSRHPRKATPIPTHDPMATSSIRRFAHAAYCCEILHAPTLAAAAPMTNSTPRANPWSTSMAYAARRKPPSSASASTGRRSTSRSGVARRPLHPLATIVVGGELEWSGLMAVPFGSASARERSGAGEAGRREFDGSVPPRPRDLLSGAQCRAQRDRCDHGCRADTVMVGPPRSRSWRGGRVQPCRSPRNGSRSGA